MFCQTPSMTVNQKNKTVTLNKEKTIELSKIVSNEKRQEKRIIDLENILKTKDSIINEKNKKIDTLIVRITDLGSKILSKEDQITSVIENELDAEKRKSKYGIYLFTDIGTVNIDNYNHIYFGGKYIREKMFYSFSVNPVNDKVFYSFGIGFKLF